MPWAVRWRSPTSHRPWADYLLALKSNQPTLVADVAGYFRTAPKDELVTKSCVEKGHGRIETPCGRPLVSMCESGVADHHLKETSMPEVSTIGWDLAKMVFQAHGAGNVVFRKTLRRPKVLEFFRTLPPCVVTMEACGGAHYWAREICSLGHVVRLIPPAYVKPFVKRQKNHASNAEAICEAAQRPTMRFVALKSEAAQASGAIFRTRDLLVRLSRHMSCFRQIGRSTIRSRMLLFAALAPSALVQPALAQTTASPSSTETVTVVGTTPLPGIDIDIDKVPGNVQTLTAADLTHEGSASTTTALNDELGSVNINDNLDDPFQPDILFRGFEASPVLGTAEGLAVYQNGVRINEAFGDSLNWDLITDISVDRITVVSANPVYGLNALGGAVIVNMKNGFSYDGDQIEVSGGSWGQRSISAQYGTSDGPFGFYIAGRLLQENGWREFSPDTVEQLYADASYREHGLTLDLSFSGANNLLSGESPTPVQELAVSHSLLFTSPQNNENKLAFVTLDAGYEVNDDLSIQSTAYVRAYWQNVVNGNTTDYTACTVTPYIGDMCQADGGTPLTNASGGYLSDISQGGIVYIGENDFETISTLGVGGSLQATETTAVFGHQNQLSVGGSLDNATTRFQSSAELGTINSALQVSFSGLLVNTPEGTPWTATPVELNATNTYYGLFATDTYNITDDLAATASGRYNLAQIDLADLRGTELSGNNRYSRFDPALGLTEKFASNLTAYAGYSEGNRAPTPGEVECSNPAAPCLLPSSLSSDPPNLRQVVSLTWEAGFRGRFSLEEFAPGQFTWNASLFRTNVDDDIYGVATSLSTGYFQNIAATRRQGAEVGLKYGDERWSTFVDYNYVSATFESTFLFNSPQNTYADANGNIEVRPGDVMPGIPANRIKAGADYRVLPSWSVGADVVYESSQYFRGDESNQMSPLPGYAEVNLHSKYELTDNVELFVNVVNALNAKYATFGVLGDPTGIGAPGIPPSAMTNGDGVDNRFESPAAPISAFGGVRIKF